MPAIPGPASLAGSLPGRVRVPGRTPTGLGVAERAGARGTSEIQIAGCARRCFRAEIEGRGFDSPHLQESSLSSEGCWRCRAPTWKLTVRTLLVLQPTDTVTGVWARYASGAL